MVQKLDCKALKKVVSTKLNRHSVNIGFPVRAYKKLFQIVVIIHVSKDHLGVRIVPKVGGGMFKVPSASSMGRIGSGLELGGCTKVVAGKVLRMGRQKI
jgi:hypothetical protein